MDPAAPLLTNAESTALHGQNEQSPQKPDEVERQPGTGRGAGDWRGHSAGKATLSVVAVLLLLEVFGRVGLISRSSFPLVSEVFTRLAYDILSVEFWSNIGHTLMQAVMGLGVGAILAIPLGLALGRIEPLERALRPIIEFLRPIPSVAILPLVILTMGVGFVGAVFLAAVSCFWMILVLTVRGAREIDPIAQQTLKVFGIPKSAQILVLILPSAMPFIVTGVRISAAVSLIVVITAELLGGMPGLGKAVQASMQSADKVGVYSYILAAGLLGLAINGAVVRLENRVLHWHASRRMG